MAGTTMATVGGTTTVGKAFLAAVMFFLHSFPRFLVRLWPPVLLYVHVALFTMASSDYRCRG
ncbi:hypothetical protein C8Q79DRAFT_947690 [Trametes meyenii]|nr:hypothetical protein C8Q79DRAFT_947690 [Trametes meyenii]